MARLVAEVGVIAAAGWLLIGCGLSSTSQTGQPVVAASPAPASQAAGSTSENAETSSVPASTAPSSFSLDAASANWYAVLCPGFNNLVGTNNWLQTSHPFPENAAYILQVGTEMNQANTRLQELPPPTHEGGAELARGALETTAAFGEFYTRYGTMMVNVAPGDDATAQHIVEEFARERSEAGPAMNFYPRKLAPEIQAAVRSEVPVCDDFWAWAGGEPF